MIKQFEVRGHRLPSEVFKNVVFKAKIAQKHRIFSLPLCSKQQSPNPPNMAITNKLKYLMMLTFEQLATLLDPML